MVSRKLSDESYILDLCDAVLRRKSLRQHRFDFLRGDRRGPNTANPVLENAGRRLPVDAFYEDLGLVIEYRECQHSEAVPFMDKRITVSGVSRGEQRRLYDARRRSVLPSYRVTLVELNYSEFAHDGRKRLRRHTDADRARLEKRLGPYLTRQEP